MHCRAYLLLEREYKRIKKNPEWGIKVTPSDQSIFRWYATISGLHGSIWENGCFHITIQFNENYDDEPPHVTFHTIPFHPNIDPITGQPCIDLYAGDHENVSGGYPITSILINIQTLLSNPVFENAVNLEAANLLKTAPHIYMQLVKNCVVESQKFVFEPGDFKQTSRQTATQYFSKAKPISSIDSYFKRPMQISFDEYHKNWVRIASSQPSASTSSNLFRDDDGMFNIKELHGHSPRRSPLYRREGSVSPHTAGKTVANDTEQKMNKLRQKKFERISAMKQLYMNNADKDQPGSTAPVTSRTDVVASGKTAEMWEKEADELVAWTTTLEEESV